MQAHTCISMHIHICPHTLHMYTCTLHTHTKKGAFRLLVIEIHIRLNSINSSLLHLFKIRILRQLIKYNVQPGMVAPAFNSNTEKKKCEFQTGLRLDPT